MSLEKILMLGKIEVRRRRGQQRMIWLDGIADSMDISLSKLQDMPWTAAHQASLSITNSWSLLKLMSIESVMLSNHLILSHLLHSYTLDLAILCIPLLPAECLFRPLSVKL